MRYEGRLYNVSMVQKLKLKLKLNSKTSIRRIRYSQVSTTFTARLICRLHSGVKVKVKVEGKEKVKGKGKGKERKRKRKRDEWWDGWLVQVQ